MPRKVAKNSPVKLLRVHVRAREPQRAGVVDEHADGPELARRLCSYGQHSYGLYSYHLHADGPERALRLAHIDAPDVMLFLARVLIFSAGLNL